MNARIERDNWIFLVSALVIPSAKVVVHLEEKSYSGNILLSALPYFCS